MILRDKGLLQAAIPSPMHIIQALLHTLDQPSPFLTRTLLTLSQVPMERYTVTVTPPGAAPIRLLIPFPPGSSISALTSEVKRRASRAGLSPDASELVLHLGDAMGPLLDEEDLLE